MLQHKRGHEGKGASGSYDVFIDRVEAAEYCPVSTMNPIAKPCGWWVLGEANPSQKHVVDEDLTIDMTEFKQALDYCDSVWEGEAV